MVPFGISHVVAWPDGLRAVVTRVQVTDLPSNVAYDYPGDAAVVIEVELDNYTPQDLTIDQAQVKLWSGPGRTPAAQIVDPVGYRNVSGTVRSGGSKLVGHAAFVVPPQDLSQVVFELRPRPGDAPARFYGSAD